MAKVEGPLLSQKATGSIKGILDYVTTASNNIVRQHPRKTKLAGDCHQVVMRIFKEATVAWGYLSKDEKKQWGENKETEPVNYGGYNAFIGWYIHKEYLKTECWRLYQYPQPPLN